MSNITTDQIDELIAQVKAGRVTRELLHAFLRNPQSVKPSDYRVTVDYGKKLEDMISDGQYDWKNNNINLQNFPVKGSGLVEIKLELVHLNKEVNMAEVEVYLEANGLRAATLVELLAFGATYLDVQREFPVIALGSSWVNRNGNRRVPYLYRRGSERSLSLDWGVDGWPEACRFLAVRK